MTSTLLVVNEPADAICSMRAFFSLAFSLVFSITLMYDLGIGVPFTAFSTISTSGSTLASPAYSNSYFS